MLELYDKKVDEKRKFDLNYFGAIESVDQQSKKMISDFKLLKKKVRAPLPVLLALLSLPVLPLQLVLLALLSLPPLPLLLSLMFAWLPRSLLVVNVCCVRCCNLVGSLFSTAAFYCHSRALYPPTP